MTIAAGTILEAYVMSSYPRGLKAPPPEGGQAAAYTVNEFCATHRLSKALFYKLPLEHRPAVIKLGRRTVISREAAAEWRRRMEAQTAEGVA